MSGQLPEDVAPYKRTPIFDQHTMPAGLRHEHRTKAGVWAVIQVIEGRLRYRIIDPPSEQILSPEQPGVVRPQQRHEVEALGDVRFFVEFYAREQTAGDPPLGDPHDKR